MDGMMPNVEQALTWAAEIAALQFENAALFARLQMWADLATKQTGAITDLEAENARLAGIVASNESYASASVPSVSAPTFPFNAIRHSR